MGDTEPDADAALREGPPQLDTLDAEDLEAAEDRNLDDRLLRRDLKARMFGSEGMVHIGRYEVTQRIGRGGMGTVYMARDPELGRKVAVKVLRSDRREHRERMLQEARALARLSHPNVVTVHEVGAHDDRVFLAMELIEGQTLRSWLDGNPGRQAIYAMFAQAARGLRAAHRAGLVHRDFKPDNVLIGADGRLRVVDFGVVKTSAEEPAAPSQDTAGSVTAAAELTHTGQLLGTPAYMAAEQFLGRPVDARTDVFALCVALYEALAGRRPFAGDDAASVSRAVLTGEPAPLAAAAGPAALVRLVERGLRRELDERPPSLDGLIDALEAAAGPVPSRRRWGLMVGLGLSGTLLLSMAAGSVFMIQPPPEHPEAALAGESSGEVEGEPDREADLAFAQIAAAPEDETRRDRAERFLEHFAEQASDARRAIAHSVIGDVLWRASCPAAHHGLCLEFGEVDPAVDYCEPPRRGPIARRPRDPELVSQARHHLEEAIKLSGVERSEDVQESRLFNAAMGRAITQHADRELEAFVEVEVPPDLDFEDAHALSSAAFKLFYRSQTETSARLISRYASVKQTGDPNWVLAAAARTGLVAEAFSESLARVPVPPGLAAAPRQAYCESLGESLSRPRSIARSAYQYCAHNAQKYEMQALPVVASCQERAEAFADLPSGE